MTGGLRLSWVHLSQPLLQQEHPERITQVHVQEASADLQGGDSIAFLGSLCRRSITQTAREYCLMVRVNFLCSRLCPLPFVLALGTTEKSLDPSSLHSPFRYLWTRWMRSPWASVSPGWAVTAFSASPQRSGAAVLQHFCDPMLDSLQYIQISLLLGEPRTGQRTPGVVSPILVDLLTTLCLMQSRLPLALAAKGHCWLMFRLAQLSGSLILPCRVASSWVPLACPGAWGCSSPGAGLCASACWTWQGSCQPESPACPGTEQNSELEGTYKDHHVHVLAPYRMTWNSNPMSKSTVHMLLKLWQLGALTLGSLFQCLTTFPARNLFLTLSLTLL